MLDLEQASVDDVAAVVPGADAVVFAAGAGPGSGVGRKDTVDRGAAAAPTPPSAPASALPARLLHGRRAGPAGHAREGWTRSSPPTCRPSWPPRTLLPRPGLDTTIVRPGALTDDPGTGRVTLRHGVERGEVPARRRRRRPGRVLAPAKTGEVVELVAGDTPVAEAVAALP